MFQNVHEKMKGYEYFRKALIYIYIYIYIYNIYIILIYIYIHTQTSAGQQVASK